MIGVGVMARRVSQGGLCPPCTPPAKGLKAPGPLDLIGGIGEGSGAPVASVVPTMPLPNSPDSNPRSKGPLPLGGEGSGEGQSPSPAAPP